MKTSLFNLHEIILEDHDVIVEFYAGDIFDIPSDIYILSAFKGGFVPVPGTTWGSLVSRTGIPYKHLLPHNQIRLSDNIVRFNFSAKSFFRKLIAIELSEVSRKNSFTLGLLKNRYRELANFLETFPDIDDESISLPLLGTGNQRISLEDSITELLKTILGLTKTNLRIIRIFAYDFKSIGALNLKISTQLNRNQTVNSHLLDAAFEEISVINPNDLSEVSGDIINKLVSLSKSENITLNPFGISGRHFAENVAVRFCNIYGVSEVPDNLNGKIQALTPHLINDRHPYVISYLRLLQNYGNQVAHHGNPDLNHQDVAAIIIAVVRVVDFYECKIAAKDC